MKQTNYRGGLGLVLLMTATIVVLGCNQGGGGAQATDTAKNEDHGWWCQEHGIPEEICGKCDKEYRDKRKAEGDWCDKHKRVKSQCFQCDPSLYEKNFEPLYVAKYGKKPERPPEKEFKD
jgi:hypothetical protein